MATLADNLLLTASRLAGEGPTFGGAALRRAVSTAYYAIFSRLAALCAERMARTAPTTESFRLIYRALDHGHARNALKSHTEFGTPLGDHFARLQEVRHWADYSPDLHPQPELAAEKTRFSRTEAQEFVALASAAMQYVDALPPDAKQRLAVTLVARIRR